jgi:hypothetical protein
MGTQVLRKALEASEVLTKAVLRGQTHSKPHYIWVTAIIDVTRRS